MPHRYFRYSERKYTDSLLSAGTIRIGTLSDFRRTEHKEGISDPNEGLKYVSHTIEETGYDHEGDPYARREIDKRALGEFSPGRSVGTHVSFKNVRVTQTVESRDYFVLCMSTKSSYETMNLFGEADNCAEIFMPRRFFRRLTRELNRHYPVIYRGDYEVKYRERTEEWNGQGWGEHPSVIKSPKFILRSEVRAIWQPIGAEPIQPIVLTETGCQFCCEEISIE